MKCLNQSNPVQQYSTEVSTAAILVVEDSPTISHAIASLLSKHKYTVHVASDGLVALSAMRVFEPDLMLLDLRLPNVDGFQLCLVVRRLQRFASLPIVILSGLSNETAIQRALDAGANDYLVKPVSEEKLLATIARHLSRVS